MILRNFFSSLRLAHKGFLLILILILTFDIFLAIGIFWGENSILTWNILRKKERELTSELNSLNQKQMDLKREIRLFKTDPQFVEKNIREKLNYVKENEILYLFEEKEPIKKTDSSHD